jgi:hypothetical protein
MAVQRLAIKGYGQIEINNCAFRRDGRVEAQCKPDATDFGTVPVENGMLLGVDNVTRTVRIPDSGDIIALVYTAEHLYDERKQGLRDFATQGKDDFLPRLGYLSVGDKYTTNCVCYDTTEWANDAACIAALKAVATTPVYAGISANGAHFLTADKSDITAGPILRVIAATTMPDGTFGVKLQCIAE